MCERTRRAAPGRAPGARVSITALALALAAGSAGAQCPTTLAVPVWIHPGVGQDASVRFGADIAFDGATAIVSGFQDSNPEFLGGSAAIVALGPDGEWDLDGAVRITPDEPMPCDRFGVAVAIEGDLAVVGRLESVTGNCAGNETTAGAAYVFRRVGGVWAQEQELLPVGGVAGDAFGWQVAIANGRIAVGSRDRDADGPGGPLGGGSVQVFEFLGGVWELTAEISREADEVGADGKFANVAMDGDTMVIAARDAPDGASLGAGAAYVYEHTVSGWEFRRALRQSDFPGGIAEADPFSRFGWDVSVRGDLIAVGARDEDSGGLVNAGAVFTYRRDGGVWAPLEKLVASDAAGGANFGHAVDLSDNSLLVGAPNHPAPGDPDPQPNQNPGAAYLYRLDPDTRLARLDTEERLDAIVPGLNTRALFGGGVALDGVRAIVGAQQNSPGASSSPGTVHMFAFGEDCNENGLCDAEEIAAGTARDCDGDGLLDDCEPSDRIVWLPKAGGDFSFDENWCPAGLPDADTTAVFDLAGGYRATLSRDLETIGCEIARGQPIIDGPGQILAIADPLREFSLRVGTRAGEAATLRIEDTTVAVSSSSVAVGASQSAIDPTLVVGSGGLLECDTRVAVGPLGTGLLRVDNGGTVFAADIEVGGPVGANGSVLVAGGGVLEAVFTCVIQDGVVDVAEGELLRAGFPFFGGVFIRRNGELTGDGTVDGNVVNFGDLDTGSNIERRGPAGGLTVEGDYYQFGAVTGLGDRSGTLTLRIDTPTDGGAPSVGMLDVTGTAELGGGLIVRAEGPATIEKGASLGFLSAQQVVGSFDVALVPDLGTDRVATICYTACDESGEAQRGPGSVTIEVVDLTDLIELDPPAQFSTAAGETTDIAVGDLNGDGLDDLVVAVSSGPGIDGQVVVLLNDGTDGGAWQGFGPAVVYSSQGAEPVAVEIVDLFATDGTPGADGTPDIAVAHQGEAIGQVRFRANGGAGAFGVAGAETLTIQSPGGAILRAVPRGLAVGDSDTDGLPNLAVLGSDGAGNPGVLLIAEAGNALGDFCTIPTCDEPGSVDPYLRDPSSPGASQAVNWAVTIPGLDTVELFDNPLGDGQLVTLETTPVGAGPFAIRSADLNGDGFPELLTLDEGGTISVLRNELAQGGVRPFAPAVSLPLLADPASASPTSFASLDLDDDADRDIAVIARPGPGMPRTVRSLRNVGVGDQIAFSSPVDLPEQPDAAPLYVDRGNLDGDGDDDLVTLSAPQNRGGGDLLEVILNRDPGPPPCSIADIAPPAGVLDLADISAFTNAFLGSDPLADIDASGVLDLQDINSFIVGFVGGCP